MKDDGPGKQESGIWIAETSHDLKTYLNPIVGFASVLIQDRGRLQEDQFRQISLIYESAKRLLDRIDALIMLLKIRSGAWPQSTETLTAQRIVKDVSERLREWADKRKTKLIVETTPALEFTSDFSLLSRAVLELAGYRIEHSEGGWVKLACRKEPGDAKRAVVISVSDSGPPPAEKERKKWQTFLDDRADSPASQKGIGLWLALAKEAVRLSGGMLVLLDSGIWEIRLPLASSI